jgi:hypothetical protein
MTNHTSILVDNFKESLKGAQTYLVVGNVTALFLLMLALQGHLVDGASEEKLDIPFLGLKAPSFFAAAVAFPLYVFSGIAAHAFLTHSRRIRDRLADIDSTLLAAVSTYPTLLSAGRAVQIGAMLLPALVFSFALSILRVSEKWLDVGYWDILVFAAPYLILAWRVRSTTAPQPSNPAKTT